LRDLPINNGGKLTLTAAAISGTFAQGSQGGALGLLHNQENFLVQGLSNSLFLQASNGHAGLNGKFYNLDSSSTTTLAPAGGGALTSMTTVTPQMGANQTRIADVINWQSGKFGGQALLGYQTISPDTGPTVKDTSLGGRVSYGIAANTKLLGELGLTARDVDGQSQQMLNKATVAVAFAPNTDFWTRPEFRIYATTANWNDAAMAANASGFGANGRTSVSTFGVQIEAWW
jgi:maltoporin